MVIDFSSFAAARSQGKEEKKRTEKALKKIILLIKMIWNQQSLKKRNQKFTKESISIKEDMNNKKIIMII